MTTRSLPPALRRTIARRALGAAAAWSSSRASGVAARRARRHRHKPGSGPRCHDARHRLFTTPAHSGTSLPALHRCLSAGSQPTSYIFDQTNIAPSTAAATTIPSSRSSISRQLCRPAHPPPKPPPAQIPIDVSRPPGSPRVPSWRACGRRPSERSQMATTGRYPKPFTLAAVHLRLADRRGRVMGWTPPYGICVPR